MANVRYSIDGYGQVEINNCAFRRDGRIEAQCELDATDFASIPAENGMLLAIDRASKTVTLPDATSDSELIGLNYSAEHIYDERTPGLANFKLERGSFLPRLGLLAVGDKFTTNCVSYADTVWASDGALESACYACATTAVYGGVNSADGSILLGTQAPSHGPVLKVVAVPGMPDGSFGVMLQVQKCL